MTRYSFNNYTDLKQAVIKHILTSDKHIILEGKGNNGKSALLRELRLFIMDHNFEFRNHPEDTYEDLTLDESEPDNLWGYDKHFVYTLMKHTSLNENSDAETKNLLSLILNLPPSASPIINSPEPDK